MRSVCLVAFALCLAQPVLAQPAPNALDVLAATKRPGSATPTPLEVLAVKRQAVIAQWEVMPMAARKVMFVVVRPSLYGTEIERPTHVFAKGEPLITYIEPVGYGWKPDGATLQFGFNVDMIVKEPDGTIIGGKTDFAKFAFASGEKMTELMLDIKLDLTGVRPGDYILEYKLRDITSSKEVTTSQAFTVAP